ncbi:39S ribosomal protein L53/MRP-L53-domain-containing protein [Pyronema omphalodes]|nr:39S ribosomal protein L53/MRP-L53-domain-containing protein [Pyronema omphalodes]
MITRHLTNCAISFNPFTKAGKTARIFASLLPPDARMNGMKITTTVLPRESKVGGLVDVTFKDGHNIKLDTSKMSVNDLVEEMDRHSRGLERKDNLSG